VCLRGLTLGALRTHPFPQVDGNVDPLYQIYFFGELIPPYIDVLGRGPHFRSTDQANVKYQKTAKCYKNTQRCASRACYRFKAGGAG
jgi:hypothetical protein